MTYTLKFGILNSIACHKMYTPKLHTHIQGQTQKHVRNVTQNKNKLNYTVNILVIGEVYGCIVENMALKTTLCTRPLLVMMTHRYKEEHSEQKGQMSYRPMTSFTLSQ